MLWIEKSHFVGRMFVICPSMEESINGSIKLGNKNHVKFNVWGENRLLVNKMNIVNYIMQANTWYYCVPAFRAPRATGR